MTRNVEIPVYARLDIRSGLLWKRIYDGRVLGLLRVGQEQPLLLQVPSGAVVRVFADGRVKILRPKNVPTRGLKEWALSLSKSRPFRMSLILHFAVLASLMVATRFSGWMFKEETVSERLAKERVAKFVDLGSTAGRPEFAPFSGVSYRAFLENLKSPDAKLEGLVGSLSQVSFNGQAIHSGPKQDLAINLSGLLGTGADSTDQNLSSQIAGTNFSFEEKKEKMEKPLSSKDQELVVQRFKELQEEFRKGYNRVLTTDPNFTVTASFEVTVEKEGKLRLSSFSPRGQFREASAQALKKEMEKVLVGSQLEPRMAGTVVRGENVFIKQ